MRKPTISGLKRRAQDYFLGFSLIGLIGAGLFFALSLAPSLIPRDPVTQGLLSGFTAAAGYWLGVLVVWLWNFVELPLLSGRAAKVVPKTALVLTGLLIVYSLWYAAEWQESLRSFMGLESLEGTHAPVVLIVAIPLALLLRELGRIFAWTASSISRFLGRLLPRRISLVLSIGLAAYLLTQLAVGTVGRFALESMDEMFLALDQLIDDELVPPAVDLVTGSHASLVAWEDLGRQGRRFIVSGPDQDSIEAFTGTDAKRPIRVYVGLGAAETPEERARLAVEEMKRVGAFDRSILVVATPTGTGWLDNEAVDSLEYLHRGDTAIVAQQYSYLTSYVSIMVEPEYSTASAKALFDAVYGHWRQLPAESRPRFYLHGLSLGASGSEQSIRIDTMLGNLIHGAVWSGPPFTNPLWSSFTRRRQPDSPYWRPRFRDGSFVRFTNQDNALEIPGAEWGPVRMVYLQYASDPITFFSTDIFLREPQWLRGVRGPDVSPDLRWVPMVTGLQVAFDMVGASSLGTGLGHLYDASHYIDAWLAVTQPDGWTTNEIERLKLHFD